MLTAVSLPLTENQPLCGIHPAALPRPFSKGLHSGVTRILSNYLSGRFSCDDAAKPPTAPGTKPPLCPIHTINRKRIHITVSHLDAYSCQISFQIFSRHFISLRVIIYRIPAGSISGSACQRCGINCILEIRFIGVHIPQIDSESRTGKKDRKQQSKKYQERTPSAPLFGFGIQTCS